MAKGTISLTEIVEVRKFSQPDGVPSPPLQDRFEIRSLQRTWVLAVASSLEEDKDEWLRLIAEKSGCQILQTRASTTNQSPMAAEPDEVEGEEDGGETRHK